MKKGKKMTAEQRAHHSEAIKLGWENHHKRLAQFNDNYKEGEMCSSTEEQLLSDWRNGFLRDDFRELIIVV